MATTDEPKRVQTAGGLSVSRATDVLIAEANRLGHEVVTEFNGFDLMAKPGDNADTVYAPWTAELARREEARQRKADEPQRALADVRRLLSTFNASPARYLYAGTSVGDLVDGLAKAVGGVTPYKPE